MQEAERKLEEETKALSKELERSVEEERLRVLALETQMNEEKERLEREKAERQEALEKQREAAAILIQAAYRSFR